MKTDRNNVVRHSLSGRFIASLTLCLPALLVLLALASTRCTITEAQGRALCSSPADGLVSWWPGEGNANDALGINNGTVQAGTTFAPGMVGQAFNFNAASGGTVIVPDSPSLRLTNQLTIEVWINNRSTNSDRAIVSKVGGSSGNNGYQMYMRGDKLMAQFNSLGLAWPAFVIQSPVSLATGVWYHVAWTYDQSAMMLYVNGLPVATNSVGAHPIAATSSTLRLSGDDNNHVYFDGLIDEPSIYKRALSASEIAAIYSAGSAGKCPIGVLSNCVPPPAGLVSWWPGEGDASDVIGRNPGTLEGGATFAAGKVGQAFQLDGISKYVDVPDSPSLNPTQCITVEAWIYPRLPLDPVAAPIVKKAGGGGLWRQDNGYALELLGTDAVRFGVFLDGNDSWNLTDSAPLSPDQWSHVAGVYDGKCVSFYFNGELVGTPIQMSGRIVPSGEPLQIGHDASNPERYFHGLIDEPSMYNTALSASQIRAIFEAGSAGKCAPAVLPSIVSQPQSQTAFVGDTVGFSVTAIGDTQLRYQWRYQGVNLTGNTNSSLTLSNVQLANAGSYSVVVSNLAGSVVSSNALLTVVPVLSNCVPAPAGLVSWWRGEGDCLDAVGTNNGTLQNGATFAAGRVGQAFSFDGVNGYVKIPKSASLDAPSQVTVDFWMNADPAQPVGSRVVGLVTSDFYGLEIGTAASKVGVGFWISTDNGAHYAQTLDANAQGAVFPAGEWHHIAGVYDGTKVQLYLDGQALGNSLAVTGRISPMLANSFVAIGSSDGRTVCSSQCIGTRYFKGLIDEVDIFNRALSPGEIAAIYNAGAAGKCLPSVAPSIITQPANQTVLAGSKANFTVTAAGTPPLSYQWRLNGAGLVGQSNSSLTISNVQLANAGSYLVVVSNLAGSVTSSNALLTVIASSNNCVPPPAGLVSWWRAEGTATDSAGTNNGVLDGGAAFGPGEVGQAFRFNGTNADVRVPASTSLNVGLADGFTIETWINPADVNQWHPMVEWNNGSVGVNFTIGDGSGAGHGALWISVKDTLFTEHPLTTTAGLLVSNVWQHVAVTYAKTNGYTVLYLNGVPRAQAALGVFTPRTIGDLYIGLRPFDGGAGGRFVGLMDEVSLYRRALSADEIAAIYHAGSAGKCPIGTTVNRSPVARCMDIVVAAGLRGFANASINNGSYDPDGDPITLVQTPLGPYPLGTNYVTLTVTDDKGASNSCSALIIVQFLHLHATLHTDGSARLQFVGQDGKSYRIEVSADLVNWAMLGICTAGLDGNAEFTDLNTTHQSPRFYRAVEQ